MVHKDFGQQTPGEDGTPLKTFVPFGSLVALQVWAEPTTEGGVIIPLGRPGSAPKRAAIRAKVIAVGPECKQVKEGDVVLICQAVNGNDCLHKGQKTWLCREDHLAGVEIPEVQKGDYDDDRR